MVIDIVAGMGLGMGTGVHPAGMSAPMVGVDIVMGDVPPLPVLNVGHASASSPAGQGVDIVMGGVPPLPALNVGHARASSPAGQDPSGSMPARGGGKS